MVSLPSRTNEANSVSVFLHTGWNLSFNNFIDIFLMFFLYYESVRPR